MYRLLDHSPRQIWHYLQRRTLDRDRPHGFSDEYPCVFVLSTGRTGTQTLAALFGLARNVFAYHEPRPLVYALSKLSYECSEDSQSFRILREAFRVARIDLLQYSLSCSRGYVETSPQVTFLAPIASCVIPSARFVHLARRPADVVRSGMRRGWYAGHASDGTRITPAPEVLPWDSWSPFRKNLWLWAKTNKWILNFTSHLPAQRRLLVRAEDLFAGQEETLERLFGFIGAPVPPRRKIDRLLGQKLNAQKTGDFPRSSDWTADMWQELSAFCGQIARQLGYSEY